MKNKKTVFVLGAGASCPYGYPSGTRLRELICLDVGFMYYYNEYLGRNKIDQAEVMKRDIQRFKEAFAKSHIKSIDMFIANNPKLAPIGKYIIAFEVFRAEGQSCFGEDAKQRQEKREQSRSSGQARSYISGTADFIGGDWYSYLYNRLIEGLIGRDVPPDFPDNKSAFITFNYDRSLEYFLYESLRNSSTEVLEDNIVQSLRKLKILHVYGQIAPLKWQDSEQGVDYRPQISESLLQKTAANIKTIYEQKESPDINEALRLLSQAGQIFFLGFGFAPENMGVLGLPEVMPPSNCRVYATAFGLNRVEVKRVVRIGFKNRGDVHIEAVDCLELLRNYLD